MSTKKQMAVKMLDDLPDELMTSVISFMAFIKSESMNRVYMDFEDNSVNDLYDIESILDETDRMAEETDIRFSHEEVFSRLKGTM